MFTIPISEWGKTQDNNEEKVQKKAWEDHQIDLGHLIYLKDHGHNEYRTFLTTTSTINKQTKWYTPSRRIRQRIENLSFYFHLLKLVRIFRSSQIKDHTLSLQHAKTYHKH